MSVLNELGLTPIYTRLAANYMQKGVGTYPCDKFGYDTVRVICDTDWNNHAHDGAPPAYSMVLRVEFYTRNRRRKWVDFRINLAGGGGEPAVRVVSLTDPTDESE